ncbi:P-loop containing nucleoside triphosphate hydrolase protein [Dichotomocladium elegans]|nr:P-loop containing nucleoside triphosphate hydrolase protein [Dichotomocladium elegans]
MAKKKKAAAGNARGFATTSVPSKAKAAPILEIASGTQQHAKDAGPISPVSPTSIVPEDPTHENHAEEDRFLSLAKRFSFINERKAETLVHKLSQPEGRQDDTQKLRSFALTHNVEFDLFQTLKNQMRREDRVSTLSHLQFHDAHGYEEMLGTLDVVYRTLVKLGFKGEDIENAFKTTQLVDIHKLLDWLCIHVPYERMPIGFYDKYFTEEGLSIRVEPAAENLEQKKAQLCHTDTGEKEEQSPVHTTRNEGENIQKRDEDILKEKILEAADRHYDYEEDDVNLKHAQYKLELVQLERLLQTGKKKKNLINVDIQLILEKISALRQTLRELESDWLYDNIESAKHYAELDHLAMEEAHKEYEIQEHAEDTHVPDPPLSPRQEDNIGEENDIFGLCGDDEDEDGQYGLFGNMLDEPQQQDEEAPVSNKAEITWEIVEIPRKKWIGRRSKELLDEYCRKHNISKHIYKKVQLSTGRWQATVRLVSGLFSKDETLIEIPGNLVTKDYKAAEELVATAALFQLDPESAVYTIMAPPLREIWIRWAKQRQEIEEKAQLQDPYQRIQMFADILDASKKYQESLDDSAIKTSEYQPETKRKEGIHTRNHDDVRKSMFKSVQRAFGKRIMSPEYRKMKEKRSELPMMMYRDEVLNLVQDNQVVIVSGETGCGKSTQVPQFLAEKILLGKSDYGSVICTQPRRISAMSIAKRVSQEMGDYPRSLGTKTGMVGYQIRLESKVSEENILVFCTTGILLRRLESDRDLQGISYVVVDEIHERTLENDFLLILLRQLCHRRPDLKVVLMSATVEAERFSNYFGGCPILTVPGRTFPVQVKYLEDAVEATGYTIEDDSRYAIRMEPEEKFHGVVRVRGKHGNVHKAVYELFEDYNNYQPTSMDSGLTVQEACDSTDNKSTKYSEKTVKTIQRMDETKINYDLILDLLEYICIRAKVIKGSEVPSTGAILVFLPGMPEIRRLYDMVASHKDLGDSKNYILIALHSTLSSEHQESAFEVPPAGMRKIVLSTNIAETGVTITDVTVVIDTGMAKVMSYDQKRRISRLRQQFITKANARQRRGRAGRVQEGLCFHLFSEPRFTQMADSETPEILRLPLEELCLRIKVCNLGSIQEFLSTALDAPSPDMIQNSIQSLQEIQALSGEETLTALGTHLANLPVDVHIGKMILFGALFRCLDPVLTIAAALSVKSPFVRPFGKEVEADIMHAKFRYGKSFFGEAERREKNKGQNRLSKERGRVRLYIYILAYIADSDFWTIYKGYQSWRAQLQKLQGIPGYWRRIRAFCDTNYMSESNLETIEEVKRQYLELLVDIGFVKTHGDELRQNRYDRGIRWCNIPAAYDEYSGSVPVVNAAIMAGLYPKLGLRKGGMFMNAKHSSMWIHPSSMLHGRESFLFSDFVVYNTVVMNHDTIYLREAAAVDAVAVMLLCADMNIKHKQKLVVLDKWMKFQCYARSAALLKFLRVELVSFARMRLLTLWVFFLAYC